MDFFTPTLPPGTIYHVGVSGGKDSTAVLLWMIHKSGIPREQIDATFADTGNEHEHTIAQIALLSETVHPITTLLPALGFFDLARKKGIFPSNSKRYCTEELKIKPAQQHLTGLLAAAPKVVSVSGVRSDESIKRADLMEWDYSSALLALQWRPIINWTLADVLAIHKEYGIPMNPLYGMGAERVGCFPCIYSRKKEVRMIAMEAPHKIDAIREHEAQLPGSSFFARDKVPPRFRTRPYTTVSGESMLVASIDDVVRWSMTGWRAKGHHSDDSRERREKITCVSGFCE